jgi:hypothetical protein
MNRGDLDRLAGFILNPFAVSTGILGTDITNNLRLPDPGG